MVSEAQTFSDTRHLKQALDSTSEGVLRTRLRTAFFTLGWRWMALLGLFFAVDVVFGLPFWLRWLCLLGQIAFVVWSVKEARRAQGQLSDERNQPEWAARVMEAQHPEVDSALINAVQFQRALGRTPAEQLPFVQREIARAETSVAAVSVAEDIDRLPERKALKTLLYWSGAWLLLALLFPGGLRAVMPRLFAPWMDDLTPPWSLTQYQLTPHGASVSYGDSLNIAVSISGPVPKSLSLMTKTAQSGWHSTALDSEEPGKYSLTLDALREDTKFYIQGDNSRSARYTAHILQPPVVKAVQVTYTYPKYTNQPSNKETVQEEGLHGLVNTHAHIEIATNRVIKNGQIAIDTGQGQPELIDLQPDAADPTHAVGDIALIKEGTYSVSLTAEDGQTNPEATKGKLKIDHDQRPAVWIERPGINLLVTPDMKVPIQVSAEDDIGVKRIEMHRIVNDLGDNPHTFPPTAETPPKKVDQTLTMDLADLGVRPGDRISYYATAFDNDPGQPNIGETDPFTLQVVSPEEFRKALREQRKPSDLKQETQDIVAAVQELAEQQQKLAEKIEKLEKQLARNPNDAAAQKQLAEAKKQQKALQAQTQQMAQQLQQYAQSPSSSDFERALKEKIGEVAQSMNQTAQGAMQKAQSGQPGQAGQNAKAAAQQLAQANAKMQQQVQNSVEKLAKIAPLYNDLERFKELLNQQGQLVLKAREFQAKNGNSAEDKARLEQLAHSQNQIQQELKSVQEDLRQHADDCQGDFPKAAASARKIADEIGARKIPDLMQSGQDNFRQNAGPQGFDKSQQALQQMQAMVKKCQACQSEAKGELDVSLSQSMGKSGLGKTLSQLGMGSQGQGQGQGQGMGIGIGVGGTPSGPTGQPGGSYAMRSSKPFVPSVKSMSGTGGNQRQRHANKTAGTPAALSPTDIEVVPGATRQPPKGNAGQANRYPVEYKKLISDYFKSVAEGQ